VTYSPTAARSVFALGVRDFAVPGMTLNSLAEAEQEVEAVQSLYSATGIPVETLTGNAATRQALQRWSAEGRGRQYRLLHFATHGADVQGDTPMESHLLLQDGPLDGLEIAEWRLNADLVVLSACHSGQRAIAGRGMNELPGDEIFGLQAAFFMAGARRVVGALWPAASQCAYSLMKEFHRRLADGIAPEVALQRAMIDHLDRANLETKRAYYWAPFVMTIIGRPLQHAPMSKDADEAAH
jgi:CHAT domain-containing protein